MGKIDAIPDVGHVGEDVEHMGPEFLAHTGERAIANLDPCRNRRRRCACIGGNAVGDRCGRGPGALRIVADREEETSDRLVFRDPFPEFDWALARAMKSPQQSIAPATSSHAPG